MIRTYDISDDDIELLKQAVAYNTDFAPAAKDDLLFALSHPVCDADQRLVFSASAFREFWDTSDEDIAWALEQADDDMILSFLGEDPIYNGWAEACESAMSELLHHLNKLKNGEGGLSLPGGN